MVPKDTRVFKCEHCGKDYGQGEIAQHSLARHIQSNHLHKYEGKRDHKCEYCRKEYTDKKNLSSHIKRVHDNAIRDVPCTLCRKLFFDKDLRNKHIRNFHKLVEHPPLEMKHHKDIGYDTPKDGHIITSRSFLNF